MTDRREAHERPDVVDALGLLAVPSPAAVRDATAHRLGTLVARPRELGTVVSPAHCDSAAGADRGSAAEADRRDRSDPLLCVLRRPVTLDDEGLYYGRGRPWPQGSPPRLTAA
jgi:hypothetical protein